MTDKKYNLEHRVQRLEDLATNLKDEFTLRNAGRCALKKVRIMPCLAGRLECDPEDQEQDDR